MKRPNEFDAWKGLKESRHHSRRKPAEPERRGWLEAILIGLIVAVCIAAVSFAGRWLDSIAFGGV
jgi:ferric-dicitrate binding protein FerR (iron transport regulator)